MPGGSNTPWASVPFHAALTGPLDAVLGKSFTLSLRQVVDPDLHRNIAHQIDQLTGDVDRLVDTVPIRGADAG